MGRRDMKAFFELVSLRNHVDDRYFKDLESGLKKVPNCLVNSTTSASFLDCRESTAQLARQHQQLAVSFRDISVELDKMIKDLKTTKTRLFDNHVRLSKERDAKKNVHAKAKLTYEDCVKKAENATINLSAAKTQCQQDKVIKKLETAVSDAVKDLDKNHKAYVKAISDCQQIQGKFEQEMASMLSQFEELETRRLTVFEEQINRFVSAQELVRKFSDLQYTFLSKSLQSIDTNGDILHFIVENYSGRFPELHVEYRPKTSDLIPHFADPAALEESNNHMLAQKQIHEHLLRNAGPSILQSLRQTYATNSAAEAGGYATGPTGGNTDGFEPTPVTHVPIAIANAGVPSAGRAEIRAVALYDFAGQEEGDLDFKVDDVITLILSDPEEEWWQGTINGRSGTFPRDYVAIQASSGASAPPMAAGVVPAPSADSPVIMKKVVAQYDFTGEAVDELSFKTGDCLNVICEIDGWFDGINDKGQRGIFPANYVSDAN